MQLRASNKCVPALPPRCCVCMEVVSLGTLSVSCNAISGDQAHHVCKGCLQVKTLIWSHCHLISSRIGTLSTRVLPASLTCWWHPLLQGLVLMGSEPVKLRSSDGSIRCPWRGNNPVTEHCCAPGWTFEQVAGYLNQDTLTKYINNLSSMLSTLLEAEQDQGRRVFGRRFSGRCELEDEKLREYRSEVTTITVVVAATLCEYSDRHRRCVSSRS